MKLFQDYRKLFSIIIFTILIIPLAFSHAQTAGDLKDKINQKDADIQQLEKEIAAYQLELDTLGEQKSSLNSAIKQLDLTKKKLNTDIAVTEKKIDKTNLKIESLSSDISTKQDTITNNVESIKLEIRKTNKLITKNCLKSEWPRGMPLRKSCATTKPSWNLF